MHLALAIAGDLGQTSGGYRYDRKLVEYCRRQGDTVDVLSFPERSYPRAVLAGLSGRTRKRLDRSVDVLLVDGICHPSIWYRRPEQPDAVVGLVHHLRSEDPTDRYQRLARPVERRYLRQTDGTIATSAFLRDQIWALAEPNGPALVAPPSGRNEGPAVSPAAVEERAAERPLQLTFVGNLLPRKDPQTLLKALGQLAETDWQLTVVGSQQVDPAYARETIALAAEMGIDDRVEFAGTRSDDQLETTLKSSHILCVPSQYETFGMVYLEAMEFGVVPIASSVGGAREFVSDGESGFLVAPGSESKVAARIEYLATNRDRLAAMGKEALAVTEEHPVWETATASIRSFLQERTE